MHINKDSNQTCMLFYIMVKLKILDKINYTKTNNKLSNNSRDLFSTFR